MDRRFLSDRQRAQQAVDAVRMLQTAARMLAEAAYEYADEATVNRLRQAIAAAALGAAVDGVGVTEVQTQGEVAR